MCLIIYEVLCVQYLKGKVRHLGMYALFTF